MHSYLSDNEEDEIKSLSKICDSPFYSDRESLLKPEWIRTQDSWKWSIEETKKWSTIGNKWIDDLRRWFKWKYWQAKWYYW